MFQALLAHLQEALHIQQLVYFMHVMLAVAASQHNTHAVYQLFMQQLLKMSK
jgi:hypothetical protein